MAGENCRSGCRDKSHASYAECLRAATPRIAYCNSANGQDFTKQRKWDSELASYRSAVASGVQPAGTTQRAIDLANRVSDLTGAPYGA